MDLGRLKAILKTRPTDRRRRMQVLSIVVFVCAVVFVGQAATAGVLLSQDDNSSPWQFATTQNSTNGIFASGNTLISI
jgi:hypothetical protein